jgi:hypothetical protein
MHGTATPKPLKGEYALDRKTLKNLRKAHERREMQAALIRDGRKCRVPRCEFPTLLDRKAHV